jgi:transposase-like protein
LFWKRKFEPQVIVNCVRWHCRFTLSLRDLEELMAERGLSVDHTTIWRCAQTYAPEVNRRLQGEVKRKSSSWHMDETFVRIAGKRMYLFRAVDGQGQTVDFYLSATRDREAAKLFLKKALANPDNRPPHVFARDGLRSYPAALRELQAEGHVARDCRQRTRRYCNNRIESDHRHVKRRLRIMQGPRTTATAWAVIQGIEAVNMIRKGQDSALLGATCTGRRGSSEACSESHCRRLHLEVTAPGSSIADATLPPH